ncbi:MAG TPA: hypothetical protein VJL89_04625, partial [Thermodesulfovibrionia bacterium]|nr:hypothetical protein [Thermodesulfovibrionia bacterium]
QDRGLTPWENLLTEARVGIAYFELEDWQHAEATLQRAVSLGTKNPKVFEYLKAFSKSGEP